jgi:predicted ribosome quality control (RQC) complex YloA/Tae2 family protein
VHNNYYFFRQLSTELETKLAGSVVSECFSQNKEELIIRFEIAKGSFYIKAGLLPSFSCLSFPENFQRARKNSVDLFGKTIGQRVVSIRQFNNERSFAIVMSNNFSLLFKMHGNRSNVILFENETISELFKKNLKADTEIQLNKLDREIDWSYAAFEKFHEKPSQLYFTFGKLVWRYLDQLDFGKKQIDEKWNLVRDMLKQLEANNFYITQIDSVPALSLLKTGSVAKVFTEAIPAVTEFYYTFTQTSAFDREKNALISSLQGKLNSGKNYYDKTQLKLNEIQNNTSYKVWADLLMANMHSIKPGTEKITLENLYNNNHPVEIKLKKDLSPQKNAALFYKKSKNQLIEIERLQEALSQKEKEIVWTEEQLKSVEQITDLKTLRSLTAQVRTDANESNDVIQPYHEFDFQGFKILVGKNAQSNDVLTFKLGYKEDLWLHAKDVAGSHVLIKYQSGKNFPKDVIERAAGLAAYNSKRKTDTLCPVIVTPRKFVRKRKGDPAGAVVVEREQVILVEPKLL